MLTVENLTISFRTDEGRITPVQDVGFSVAEGRTLGQPVTPRYAASSASTATTRSRRSRSPPTASVWRAARTTRRCGSGTWATSRS